MQIALGSYMAYSQVPEMVQAVLLPVLVHKDLRFFLSFSSLPVHICSPFSCHTLNSHIFKKKKK